MIGEYVHEKGISGDKECTLKREKGETTQREKKRKKWCLIYRVLNKKTKMDVIRKDKTKWKSQKDIMQNR